MTNGGKVIGFGLNSKGRITGNAMEEKIETPTLIQELSDIVKVSAGYFHSLALDKSGKVFSCGGTNKGETGK